MAQYSWKQAKRLAVLVIGSTVLLIGLVGALLPGIPAVLLVPLGLAILGTEFVWARRLLRKVKERAQKLTGFGGASSPSSAEGSPPVRTEPSGAAPSWPRDRAVSPDTRG
jgi:hypothetical protein